MNELVVKNKDIKYTIPTITFPSYKRYLERAQTIADTINALDLTVDDVKSAKRSLADARKVTDALNRVRIDIKKDILSSYEPVEQQIKELCKVIDDADKELRAKVRALEEAEREEKKERIREIWQKRSPRYSIERYMPDAFDRFLQPSHLNKTTTMKSIEKDMVAWLEAHERCLDTVTALGDDYVVEYLKTDDLAAAIASVKDRQAITDMLREDAEDEDMEETAVFVVKGTKDITLTEMLLMSNEIKYERK